MKRSLWQRAKLKVAVLGASGVLLQVGDAGCASFFSNVGLNSIDFCFLLDCNAGALGGLIDFCSPVNFTSFVGGDADQVGGPTPFLADCPQ